MDDRILKEIIASDYQGLLRGDESRVKYFLRRVIYKIETLIF